MFESPSSLTKVIWTRMNHLASPALQIQGLFCVAYTCICNVTVTQAFFTAECTAFTFKTTKAIGITNSCWVLRESRADGCWHLASNVLIRIDAETPWRGRNIVRKSCRSNCIAPSEIRWDVLKDVREENDDGIVPVKPFSCSSSSPENETHEISKLTCTHIARI